MKVSQLQIATIFAVTCCLSSCATSQPPEKADSLATQTIQEMQTQQASNQPQISQQDVLASMLPPVSQQTPLIIEEKFDVSVKGIDARSFLLGLVDGTDYNMVVSPEVNTKITLQLKNVSVSEVLTAIERIYPLMVERQGSMFFVSSAETMTAIYPVDYLNLSRKGKSRTSVAGQTVAGGQNNQSNNRGGGQNNNRGGGQNNVTLLNSSEITTDSKSDFWTDLTQSLNLIIKNEEKANVIVSPNSGVVIVSALPQTQRLVKEFLGVTQNSLNRQVTLEAKIIEVSLKEGFQAGIDWSRIRTVNGGDSFTFGQQGQVVQNILGDPPLNGIFSMLYQGASFDAAIDLLKEQGDVQVLSSPRVSTINNQKAVIKVGSDEFFVTDVSTTTVTGNSTSTTPDVTLTPFFSGISLDVTPQISQQGEIVLHIHPVVSEVNDQQKTLTLGQDEFTLPLALTNVRESDSIVKTRDQQVIVIGGLMQTKTHNTVSSTPLLGDIPFVGGAFRQTRESQVKSELVILLRAHLVSEESTNDELNQLKNRFNSVK
ncbi:pilus (MSHA type) biogenesis protein MshL [Aliikangiella sp. IMCC44632]